MQIHNYVREALPILTTIDLMMDVICFGVDPVCVTPSPHFEPEGGF